MRLGTWKKVLLPQQWSFSLSNRQRDQRKRVLSLQPENEAQARENQRRVYRHYNRTSDFWGFPWFEGFSFVVGEYGVQEIKKNGRINVKEPFLNLLQSLLTIPFVAVWLRLPVIFLLDVCIKAQWGLPALFFDDVVSMAPLDI